MAKAPRRAIDVGLSSFPNLRLETGPFAFVLDPIGPLVNWYVVSKEGRWLGVVEVPAAFDVHAATPNAL